jgi:hypothetical protein
MSKKARSPALRETNGLLLLILGFPPTTAFAELGSARCMQNLHK